MRETATQGRRVALIIQEAIERHGEEIEELMERRSRLRYIYHPIRRRAEEVAIEVEYERIKRSMDCIGGIIARERR